VKIQCAVFTGVTGDVGGDLMRTRFAVGDDAGCEVFVMSVAGLENGFGKT